MFTLKQFGKSAIYGFSLREFFQQKMDSHWVLHF